MVDFDDTKTERRRFSPLSYLLGLSAKGGSLFILTVIVSGLSGIISVAPFYALYRLILLVGGGSGQNRELLRWGTFIAVAGLVYLLVFIASMMLSHLTAFRVLRDIRYSLAKKLLELPLGWFGKKTTGDVRKLFTEDVEKIELFIAHHVPDFIRGMVTPLTILVFLFSADWRLGLASLIPLVIAPFFIAMIYRSYNKDMPKYYSLLAKMNGTIIEYIRGMSVVRAFNRTAASFGDYKSSVDEYFSHWKMWTIRALRLYSGFNTGLEASAFCILAVGGPLFLAGAVEFQVFLIAMLLGPAYISSVKTIYLMTSHMSMNFQGAARIKEVLEAPALSEPSIPLRPGDRRIDFSGVSFAYEEEDAVSDLSFDVRPGTITALVGASGAGKTTAALLAARFYDPRTGVVRLGGAPYPSVGTKALMRSVSICFQEAQVFKGTIEENIRMGNRAASFQEVVRAARAARVHEFVEALPRGYKTEISGDRTLSGGQIQRIAIARAILKDSPVVILDEATSYADPENERLIQEALNELLGDKSVIVVAHRLKTLRHVDMIHVFERGRIVESGNFEELVDAGGTFSRLWASATEALEWSVLASDRGIRDENGKRTKIGGSVL